MVRVKERYLLVNILYPRSSSAADAPDFVALRGATPDLTPQLLVRGIKAEVHALFGDCGAGAVERTLKVKYLSRPTSTFILRITREHLRYVWAALTFMHHVPMRNGRSCVFRVTRVGGTIRKVEEEAIRQARTLILATKAYMAGNRASALALLAPTTVTADGTQSRVRNVLGDVVSDGDDNDNEDADEDDEFGDVEDGDVGDRD